MLRSMTGYGRGKYQNDSREYIVEIKSVNHKYNDISIKLPRNIMCFEERIKKIISNNVSRGKIDVFITFNNYSEEGKNVIINKELAKKWIDFMLEPEIALLNFDEMHYGIANLKTIELIKNREGEEVLKNEAIFPNLDDIERYELYRDLGSFEENYNDCYKKIKSYKVQKDVSDN